MIRTFGVDDYTRVTRLYYTYGGTRVGRTTKMAQNIPKQAHDLSISCIAEGVARQGGFRALASRKCRTQTNTPLLLSKTATSSENQIENNPNPSTHRSNNPTPTRNLAMWEETQQSERTDALSMSCIGFS